MSTHLAAAPPVVDILTPEAQDFLSKLARAFTARRNALLKRRAERQTRD